MTLLFGRSDCQIPQFFVNHCSKGAYTLWKKVKERHKIYWNCNRRLTKEEGKKSVFACRFLVMWGLNICVLCSSQSHRFSLAHFYYLSSNMRQNIFGNMAHNIVYQWCICNTNRLHEFFWIERGSLTTQPAHPSQLKSGILLQ